MSESDTIRAETPSTAMTKSETTTGTTGMKDTDTSSKISKTSVQQKWDTARALAAFWIFGLCNNYGYVIMLSAAEDILDRQEHHNTTNTETKCLDKITSRHCATMTTGAVLLADILPCMFVKLSFPFFMQRIPFGIRHLVVCVLQAVSYFIVAFSTSVPMSLIGVVFASLSSGLGEITYLSLTPYFDKNTISTWSSGTGGAGVIGALAYAALTEPHLAGLEPKTTLLIMLVIPAIFALAYWCLLSVPKSVHQVSILEPKTWIVPDSCLSTTNTSIDSVYTEPPPPEQQPEEEALTTETVKQRKLTFKEMILTTIPLLRFMIPLMLVYIGEYLINQGIVQLIFYTCDRGWYLTRSSQYRWYQVLYQVGVFFSRSSINIIQLPYWALVVLPILQFMNVIIFFFESLYFYIPHIWILFVLILFEGLFGGSSYVNTFSHIHSFAKPDVREFSMSISSLGDSIGIVIAGFASIPLHNYVCSTSLPAHVLEY